MLARSSIHALLVSSVSVMLGCGPEDAPANIHASLRIGTFNTFLISPGMRCLGDLNPVSLTDCLLFAEDLSETNAGPLADSILDDPFDYDVIALNEVFDEDAREVLVDKLKGHFPYYVSKIDGPTIATDTVVEFNPEDSGLALFSRFPVVALPDADDRYTDTEGTIKEVAFKRFDYCANALEDCLAAKGVALVRIEHPDSKRIYNVAFTHLEADSENSSTRTDQLLQVESFIIDVLAPVAETLHDQELLIMGDLNIDGLGGVLDPAASGGQDEWTDTFGSPGVFLYDQVWDSWARTTSQHDTGVTYRYHGQRLDYILTNTFGGQEASHSDYYCVQHLTRLSHGDSDHLAVRADHNLYNDYCNPRTAWVNPPIDQVTATPDLRIRYPGSMQWLYVDVPVPATFSVQVGPEWDESQQDGVLYELYDPSDLSTPLQPHLGEKSEWGWKHKVSGSFYIRIYSPSRTWTGDYHFFIHKHTCTSYEDACVLDPHEEVDFEDFHAGLPLNAEDAAWWQVDVVEVADSGEPQDLLIFARDFPADVLELELRERNNPGQPLNELPLPTSGSQPNGYFRRVEAAHTGPLSFYLRLARSDATVAAPVTVGWQSNLTILHGQHDGLGGPNAQLMELICIDETNGLAGNEAGSDEIHLMYNVDGGGWYQAAYKSFDCNSQRQYYKIEHTAPVRYLESFAVKLIEGDGFINPDDDGPHYTIPILPPDDIGSVYFEFEGGEYRFTLNRSWKLNYPN